MWKRKMKPSQHAALEEAAESVTPTVVAVPPAKPPRPSKINERALRAHLVGRHGEALADVMLPTELSKARAAELAHHALLDEQEAIAAELERRQSQMLADLVPLRAAMDEAYARWMDACAAHEAARVRIDSDCHELTSRHSELRTRIATLTAPGAIGVWGGKPDWFKEPLPEHPSEFHKMMHAQQLRNRE